MKGLWPICGPSGIPITDGGLTGQSVQQIATIQKSSQFYEAKQELESCTV
jgi:hypothetical protein